VRPIVIPPLLALAWLASVAGPAVAAPSRVLWATINICDAPSGPDSMGVRASMPGTGGSERMYMRFAAEWFSPPLGRWVSVKGNGRSGWLYAGAARYRSRQAGWTFDFGRPRAGNPFLLRAVVGFEWRSRKKVGGRGARWVVVRRRRAVTRAGVRGVAGGDPPGQSLASCSLG
jgi:hypothetical protein